MKRKLLISALGLVVLALAAVWLMVIGVQGRMSESAGALLVRRAPTQEGEVEWRDVQGYNIRLVCRKLADGAYIDIHMKNVPCRRRLDLSKAPRFFSRQLQVEKQDIIERASREFFSGVAIQGEEIRSLTLGDEAGNPEPLR